MVEGSFREAWNIVQETREHPDKFPTGTTLGVMHVNDFDAIAHILKV